MRYLSEFDESLLTLPRLILMSRAREFAKDVSRCVSTCLKALVKAKLILEPSLRDYNPTDEAYAKKAEKAMKVSLERIPLQIKDACRTKEEILADWWREEISTWDLDGMAPDERELRGDQMERMIAHEFVDDCVKHAAEALTSIAAFRRQLTTPVPPSDVERSALKAADVDYLRQLMAALRNELRRRFPHLFFHRDGYNSWDHVKMESDFINPFDEDEGASPADAEKGVREPKTRKTGTFVRGAGQAAHEALPSHGAGANAAARPGETTNEGPK